MVASNDLTVGILIKYCVHFKEFYILKEFVFVIIGDTKETLSRPKESL